MIKSFRTFQLLYQKLHLSGFFWLGYLAGRISISPFWNQTSRLGCIPLAMFVKATPWFMPFLKNETVLFRAS